MAQDIAVWCDIHWRRDSVRVPGTRVSVMVNDFARVFDLCDACRIDLVVPLCQAMSEYGNVPSRPAVIRRPYSKGEAGEFPCTFPNCGKSYRHKSTLRTHVGKVHDMTLGQLYKDYGDGGAVRSAPPSAGEYLCPECLRAGERRMFTRSQGLGMHRSKVHGVRRD